MEDQNQEKNIENNQLLQCEESNEEHSENGKPADKKENSGCSDKVLRWVIYIVGFLFAAIWMGLLRTCRNEFLSKSERPESIEEVVKVQEADKRNLKEKAMGGIQKLNSGLPYEIAPGINAVKVNLTDKQLIYTFEIDESRIDFDIYQTYMKSNQEKTKQVFKENLKSLNVVQIFQMLNISVLVEYVGKPSGNSFYLEIPTSELND